MCKWPQIFHIWTRWKVIEDSIILVNKLEKGRCWTQEKECITCGLKKYKVTKMRQV